MLCISGFVDDIVFSHNQSYITSMMSCVRISKSKSQYHSILHGF